MTTTAELALKQLQLARGRITPHEAWIKGEFACSRDRMPVNSDSPDAVCWCSVGALNAARSEIRTQYGAVVDLHHGDQKARQLLRTVVRGPVAQFNDEPTTTHEEVLAAFDEAIELAKGTV